MKAIRPPLKTYSDWKEYLDNCISRYDRIRAALIRKTFRTISLDVSKARMAKASFYLARVRRCAV